MGIFTIVEQPLLPEVEVLENTFFVFGLSLQATAILLGCALTLFWLWESGNQKNSTHLVWSISFALYSIVFIGMILQSLGVTWANTGEPAIFFAFRNFMIIWVAGMFYGISKIMNINKTIRMITTSLALVAGYAIFFWGLLLDPATYGIEWTMYAFLFLELIPLCFTLAYMFLKHYRGRHRPASLFLASGFAGVALVYAAWAPWHLTKFYFVWFFLFNLTITLLLIGFILVRVPSFKGCMPFDGEKPKKKSSRKK